MKKRNMFILSVLALPLVLAIAAENASNTDWLTGTTAEKFDTLASIQPGLGTVMIEYGNRYTNLFYAAKGGNWGLAAYMLKELREIQEVGETTRPTRAEALKVFEQAFLDPLDDAIQAKDFKDFKKIFDEGVNGCNGCHASQGFPFIKYVLPRRPVAPLSMRP
jgi:hypothetical protein